jgi:tetratricopeptide (TPR) repeat protein
MIARRAWPVWMLLACADPQGRARREAVEAHRHEARAALAKGDAKRAAIAAEAAVETAPETWEARALRLEVRAGAMARFPERASEARPEELDYRLEMRLREGVVPRAPWLVARAHLAMKRGDLAAATAFTKEAMEAGDAPGLAWLLQARLELATGRGEAAEASLRKAREADAADTESARVLAGVLLRRGRAAEAAALLEPVLDATSDAAAMRTYGIALFATGNAQGCGAALERARAIDGDDAETHRALADWHLAGGRLDEAAAAYDRVVQLGDAANGRYGLAMVAVRRGEVEGAARAFEALLAGPVPHVGAYLEAGDVYETAGRADEALRTYRRFVEVGARDPSRSGEIARARARIAALAGPPPGR